MTSDVPGRVGVGVQLATAAGEELEIAWIDPSGRLVRFVGVDSLEAATPLAGQVLYAQRQRFEGITLIDELVEKQLVDQGGVMRGRVVAIEANPASELMVLDTGALVPTVFISDIQGDRIVVEVPDGLFS